MLSARFQAAGRLGLAALVLVVSASSGADPAPVDAKTLGAWWADLEKGETAATRALLNLSDHPKEAVIFLKTKMKPLTITSGQVKALLLKLGNTNEAVWRPAFEELEYFDPRLAIELQTLMDRYKEPPTRQCMVEVLSGRPAGQLNGKEIDLRNVANGFNFFAKPNFGSWWAEHRIERINTGDLRRDTKKKWTRAVRAIVLLEHIGTPDALAILKDMATGHPDAYPTKMAKDAFKAAGGQS
jgi:hypothetical protein